MFYFDSAYMLFAIVGMIIVYVPQSIVKSTYKKFLKKQTSNRLTGGEVAQSMLQKAGVHNVRVEPTPGELSDHYDPSQKVVRLSQDIFYGRTVSSYGIAAHEVGHAIQDNTGYIPMKLRAGLLPAVQTGQSIGPILLMAGLFLRFATSMEPGLTDLIALIGLALYGSVVLFHVATLPVEFNASMRAVKVLADGGYLVDNEEVSGAKKVLSAAALTYVAAALYALMELLYWAWMLFGRNRD